MSLTWVMSLGDFIPAARPAVDHQDTGPLRPGGVLARDDLYDRCPGLLGQDRLSRAVCVVYPAGARGNGLVGRKFGHPDQRTAAVPERIRNPPRLIGICR